ncbi:MAG: F0F1 ATP synthase subunit delta [Gammaproteobacteria bacterium]|nr:F0F1 ATP synthase subunit delta [Gammaproteobacteria bacterium]MDH5730534.1 F0F1 ATP synthase subunit delta [Gammaproteobacteria bacterium]
MAETQTIARPYAQAVFDLAVEKNALASWFEQLSMLAEMVSNDQIAALIGNPKVSNEDFIAILEAIAKGKLSPESVNLLKLLAENNRVTVIPDIALIFEELKAEAEKTVKASCISAVELDNAMKQKIISALKARLGREVELSCQVDANLLGGAIIRAGDLVIDGSVGGQLERLTTELVH